MFVSCPKEVYQDTKCHLKGTPYCLVLVHMVLCAVCTQRTTVILVHVPGLLLKK